MDVLDDILTSLRLNGGVVFDARTRGDWCLLSQFQPGHCAPYFPVPERIISYHFVRKGHVFASIPGGATAEVSEGSMVLFPRNDPHYLFTKAGLEPADIAAYVGRGAGGAVNSINMDFGGEEAHCYCGWLGVLSGSHPLLDALPAMLLVDRDSHAADWVSSSLRVASGEWHASPIMVAKISELLFVQAVRRYVDDLREDKSGWLTALRDPAVARALSVIHERYAHDLDVETLAREAGVSRTVLGERFAELIGEPPMRYCARWRMRVAATRLIDGNEPTATIAYSVGFGSEAAFNRAFKREYGEPPAAWKRRTNEQAKVANATQVAA